MQNLNSIPLADTLSLIPGIQQVVGLGTIGSNSLKALMKAINILSKKVLILYYEYKRSSYKPSHKENDKKNWIHLNLTWIIPDKLSDILKQLDNDYAKMSHNLTYIGIGIKRFIPILGTYYSYSKIQSYNIDPSDNEDIP